MVSAILEDSRTRLMNHLHRTSVIIITKNRPGQLISCVDSLAKQTIQPNEVVIIDSSDSSQWIRQKVDRFSLVYRYTPHCSIPKAREMGIEIATYPLVLFLDDDCTAEKDWLKKMVALSSAHPRAALIAGSLVHVPTESVYAQIIRDIRKQRVYLAGHHGYIYFNIENCLIKREFVKRHQIQFDETMLHEDFADFALQVKRAGGDIVISNGPKVYHYERQNLLSFLRQRFKNSGNLARLKRKWPKQQFHFYASRRSSFLNIFITRVNTFIKKGESGNCLKYVGIIVLSVAAYELGNLYYTVLYHERLNKGYIRIKSTTDFFLAIVFFIVSIPAMVLIGLIIKMDSPGPVIFSQIRIGKNLRLFRFYKFRTMWHDAKLRFPDLYNYQLMSDKVDTFKFKTTDDPRLTRFGRYLRKTSLDELPNFINVIRGDMSLVGPRPEIPEMLPYYQKEEMVKFTVKPGITGYAQVMGRGLLTFKQTIKYDITYVSCQGFLVDIKTMIWTIYVVLRGFGAF